MRGVLETAISALVLLLGLLAGIGLWAAIIVFWYVAAIFLVIIAFFDFLTRER